jgi:hypothetical protein
VNKTFFTAQTLGFNRKLLLTGKIEPFGGLRRQISHRQKNKAIVIH